MLKEAEPAELLQAFRLAVAGGNYLHPRLGALMATGEGVATDGVVLSERERGDDHRSGSPVEIRLM